jgi:hypothetical protein
MLLWGKVSPYKCTTGFNPKVVNYERGDRYYPRNRVSTVNLVGGLAADEVTICFLDKGWQRMR